MKQELEYWSGRVAFVLAAIGSAVGIGNIWRFPYIMGQNGGLAFLVPYFACIILVGIPILMLEIGAGMHFRASYLGVLKKIRFPRILGFFPLVLVFFILSYYIVITSWMLFYAFGFFSGIPVSFALISGSYLSAVFFIATFFLLYVILSLGVHKGIEPAVRMLIPALGFFLLAVGIYVLSKPGALEKTLEKLVFDWSYVESPKTWLFALSQSVFSLSIGMGLMMTYAAYIKKKQEITSSSCAIAMGDTAVSMLSVLIVFPLVFLAGGAISEGTLLSLDALPAVFGGMPFGNLVGGLFFLTIFIAAFTSAISMAELPVLCLEGEAGFPRQKAVDYALFGLMAVSVFVLLSYSPLNLSLFGMPVLDLLDFVFGSLLAPLSALVVCVALAHYWDSRQFLILANIGDKRVEEGLLWLVKWVIPGILIGLFLYGILNMEWPGS